MSKKKGILLIGVALLLATGGVVYAHWQNTLVADVNVNTGNIELVWQYYGTDDDGEDNTGFVGADSQSATDDGGPGAAAYDAWALDSSADPAEMWRCGSGTCGYKLNGLALDRYDKDVAKCTVGLDPNEPHHLIGWIEDGYPSYYCTIFSQISNEGNVPVKATTFGMQVPGTVMYVGTEYVAGAAGTTAWCNLPANAGKCPLGSFGDIPEAPLLFTFDFVDGTACGHQLDPFATTGDMDLNAFWVHVEQGDSISTPWPDSMNMGQDFNFHWEMDFVNWNEWEPCMCQIYVNGNLAYNPPGCPAP